MTHTHAEELAGSWKGDEFQWISGLVDSFLLGCSRSTESCANCVAKGVQFETERRWKFNLFSLSIDKSYDFELFFFLFFFSRPNVSANVPKNGRMSGDSVRLTARC